MDNAIYVFELGLLNEGWVIPAIMAAAGIVNSIIAARSSKKQAHSTNLANMQLAKYQADRNEQFVDKQNEYNTPANQMARFAAGGLNPHLIYGQGNAGNQASPASYQAPRVDLHATPFQLPEVLGQYQDYQMKAAQIDNVKAATEATQAETRNKIWRSLLMDIQKKKGDIDLAEGRYQDLAQSQVDIKKGQAQSAYPKWEQEMQRVRLLEEQIKQVQAGTSRTKVDTLKKEEERIYMQLRNQMFKKQGLTPTDNILLRLMSKAVVNAFGISIDDVPRLVK